MKAIKKKWFQFFLITTLVFSASIINAEEAEIATPTEQQFIDKDVFLYKTIPGDSLWNIAQRHLHSIKLWTELKKVNNLRDDNHLEPGTLIKVPREWLKVNESTATLVNTIGTVKIINNDKETLEFGKDFTDKDSLVLTKGDTIITGDDGLATILFKDGSRLLLQSNSELILNDLIALGDGSLSDIKLKLEKGRLENRVYSSPISNTNYEVKTSKATTSVRGTVFRMGLGEDQDSITEVVSGKVMAKGTDEIIVGAELLAGEAIIISKDGDTKKIEMLPAPELTNFPQLIEAVPIRIDVESIEGVAGYSTKIIPVGNDEQDAVSSKRSESNVLLGEDLVDGRYRAIVSAIDANGVTGNPASYEFILNARPFAPKFDSPTVDEKILLRNLVFNWTKLNDEAKTFYLQVARDIDFRDIVIDADNLTEPTFKPENLLSGIYHWRVASIDKDSKRGPFSASQSFRILLEDPNLEKANVKTANINLEWAPLEAGTEYLIQISNSVSFENVLLEKSLSANTLYVENLVPGTYYFRIQSTASDQYVSEWGLPHKFEVLDIESVSEKIK